MSESKKYILRYGDDVRDMAINLTEDGEPLSVEPVSAILKINKLGTIISRALTGSGASWAYRWTDADFLALGAGTFPAEILCTFSDASTATFPTKGQLTIAIFTVMP